MNFMVDIGAQVTVISKAVMEATKINTVLDDNIQMEVVGVGQNKSIGLVKAYDICIQGEYFAAVSSGFFFLVFSIEFFFLTAIVILAY